MQDAQPNVTDTTERNEAVPDPQDTGVTGISEAELDRRNGRLTIVLCLLLAGFGVWKAYALLAPVYL